MKTNKPYKTSELEYVRENAHRMTVKEIADKLGRTRSAVAQLGNRNGISFVKRGRNHYAFGVVKTK